MTAHSDSIKVLAGTLWKYAPPTIAFTGLVGNSLTLLATTNKDTKKSSFTVYLAALAVVDILILLVCLCQSWLPVAFGIILYTYSDTSCKLFRFVLYLMPAMGAWLLVVISAERMFCMTRPHLARTWCRPKVAMITILALFLVLGGLDSHILYGFALVDRANRTMCKPSFTSYQGFIYGPWVWIDFVVSFLVPAASIILANAVTVITVFRSVAAFSESSLSTRRKSLLVITISISLAFILLVTPLYVWLHSGVFESKDWRMEEDALAAASVCLYMMNSAINFLLYVFSGSRFRDDLKKALCG